MKKQSEAAGGLSKPRTLSELAAETGLPERTIRYYIARGLLEGPVRGGRGAAYTGAHVERLKEIQRLQSKGLMLAEISRILGGGSQEALPEPATCWRYKVADDVVVEVRSGISPWRMKQVRAAIEVLARRVAVQRRDTNPGKDEHQ